MLEAAWDQLVEAHVSNMSPGVLSCLISTGGGKGFLKSACNDCCSLYHQLSGLKKERFVADDPQSPDMLLTMALCQADSNDSSAILKCAIKSAALLKHEPSMLAHTRGVCTSLSAS